MGGKDNTLLAACNVLGLSVVVADSVLDLESHSSLVKLPLRPVSLLSPILSPFAIPFQSPESFHIF